MNDIELFIRNSVPYIIDVSIASNIKRTFTTDFDVNGKPYRQQIAYMENTTRIGNILVKILAEEPKVHKYGIELTEDKDSKKLFASVRLAKVDDVELAKLSGYNKKLDKVMENVTKVLNEIEEELKNITKEEIK